MCEILRRLFYRTKLRRLLGRNWKKMLEHYKKKLSKFLCSGKNVKKFNFLRVIIVYIFFIQTFIIVSFFHSYLLYIADESQADKVLYEEYKRYVFITQKFYKDLRCIQKCFISWHCFILQLCFERKFMCPN